MRRVKQIYESFVSMYFAFAFFVVVVVCVSLSFTQHILCKPTQWTTPDAYMITCVLRARFRINKLPILLTIYWKLSKRFHLFTFEMVLWIVLLRLIHLRHSIFINFYFRLAIVRLESAALNLRSDFLISSVEMPMLYCILIFREWIIKWMRV